MAVAQVPLNSCSSGHAAPASEGRGTGSPSMKHGLCKDPLRSLQGSTLCPKFLLIDGWWQLGFDVHQRPLHHHQRIVIQEIHKEQRLRGGGGTGREEQS